MVMSRNLEVAEIRKFEAMLAWARHKIRSAPTPSKIDAKIEFKCTMERLARDLKLYRISPQDLIKVNCSSFLECKILYILFRRNSSTCMWLRLCSDELMKRDMSPMGRGNMEKIYYLLDYSHS